MRRRVRRVRRVRRWSATAEIRSVLAISEVEQGAGVRGGSIAVGHRALGRLEPPCVGSGQQHLFQPARGQPGIEPSGKSRLQELQWKSWQCPGDRGQAAGEARVVFGRQPALGGQHAVHAEAAAEAHGSSEVLPDSASRLTHHLPLLGRRIPPGGHPGVDEAITLAAQDEQLDRAQGGELTAPVHPFSGVAGPHRPAAGVEIPGGGMQLRCTGLDDVGS